jgi:hypothetical protein
LGAHRGRAPIYLLMLRHRLDHAGAMFGRLFSVTG